MGMACLLIFDELIQGYKQPHNADASKNIDTLLFFFMYTWQHRH